MIIKDFLAISPQNTYNNTHYLSDIKTYFGNKLLSIEPDYTGIIKLNLLRRMGKALRMGIGCGVPLLQKYGLVDGIIIGTSEGGLEDCIKFLNQIVDYDEGTLTPTNFVQSTPNALSGYLALINGNNNYNITHVNKGLAFENALIDAKMLFEENKADILLVGGVEEISDYNFNIENSAEQFKKTECYSNELINSKTEGTVCGEGSVMFILNSQKTKGSICIEDIHTITYPEKKEIKKIIKEFIGKNNLEIDNIDAVITGYNGNIKTDFRYDNIIDELFTKQTILTYKNLVGEYPTSSAFAVMMGHNLMTNNKIPDEISLRNNKKELNNILIYNHYKEAQHSLILLSKCLSSS